MVPRLQSYEQSIESQIMTQKPHAKLPWRKGQYGAIIAADAQHNDDAIKLTGFAMGNLSDRSNSMTKPKDNLLPCPFCGSEKVRAYTRSGVRGKVCRSRYFRGFIQCKDCGATSGTAPNPENMVRNWNKRVGAIQ